MKFYPMEIDNNDRINYKIFKGYNKKVIKEATIFLINLWVQKKPEKFSIIIS